MSRPSFAIDTPNVEQIERVVGSGRRARLRAWRKRVMWRATVWSSLVVKRIIDLVVSAMALVSLLPLFAVVAIAIKLTDGGPVLFWQTRVGRYGRALRFPKFRSMRVDAEQRLKELLKTNDHGDSVTFKMKTDPRVTAVGRIIRKLSIDELPQLWCVLKGEMSLVGPGFPVPREVEKYTLADRRRLEVKPGLTCIWQVSGRGDIPFDQQVGLDVDYIESRNIQLDLKLLAQTVPAVLLGRGAY